MKKIGKAKINLEEELWATENGTAQFENNRRLVDLRPDVKKFVSKYKKLINGKRPSRGQPLEREAFFKACDEAKRQWGIFFSKIYREILEESQTSPIPLHKAHDYDHTGQWRYCLYHGMIYQFDQPNLSDETMVQQIEAYEGRGKEAV